MIACFSPHKAQIWTLFRRHSCKGCFYLHLEKKIDQIEDFSSFFFLNFSVSNCELNVPRRSILKSSNKFPNSTLVTPLEADLVTHDIWSWGPLPTLAWILEYFLHKSRIYGRCKWDISPKPIKFKTSMYSSLIPFKKSPYHVIVQTNLFSFLEIIWKSLNIIL